MTTYYVATSGSDSGNGSSSSPWKTISKAMKANLKPGDEVVVKAGTYHEMVRISASGNENNYITVRSEKPGAAKIVTSKDYGVHVQGDYVKLDGFDISGAKVSGVTAHMVHHVKISNNVVHDNTEHGISASRSDFITIEGNTTYDNASSGARSGISVFQAQNISGDSTSKGFRIIVRDNISYDNVTKSGAHTDGNGIIIDDFQASKSKNLSAYKFTTLVENNLVYGNGGKGIQVAWSDNVTVRNNTSYHNNTDSKNSGTWRGELSNMNSSNNVWVNNIAVASTKIDKDNTAIDNTSFNNYDNKNVVWVSNLTYNGTSGSASTRSTSGDDKISEKLNLLGIDPDFVNAPSNFELKAGSAAIDAGTKAYGYATSGLDSGARVGAVDLGAYEYGNGSTSSSSSSSSSDSDTSSSDSDSSTSGVTKTGNAKANSLSGGAGDDKLSGFAGNDTLTGNAGDDLLKGNNGKDRLIGGLGHDTLVGGNGADTFVFRSAAEAGKGSDADDIRDFSRSQGDKINLSGIDANTKASGNQAFDFIGSKAFSGDAGELRYVNGRIHGDMNGDKVADFHIDIENGHGLIASDFIL